MTATSRFWVVMVSSMTGDFQGRTFSRWNNAVKHARRMAESGYTLTIVEVS